MRAQVVLHLLAHGCHGLVEDGLHKGHAPAAACAGFGAGFDVADALAGAVFYGVGDVAFEHVVAGAYLGVFGSVSVSVCVCERIRRSRDEERGDLQVAAVLFAFGANDELAGWCLQWLFVLDHGDKLDVVLGVAYHHPAQEVLPIESEEVFFVHLLERVLVGQGLDWRWCRALCEISRTVVRFQRFAFSPFGPAACRRRSMPPARQFLRPVPISEEVTETGHLHAQELQLRAQIRTFELAQRVRLGLCEVECEHVGHFDARGDEAKGGVLPARALADGVDVRLGCGEVVINDYAAAAVGAFDVCLAGEFVSGSYADLLVGVRGIVMTTVL